MTQTSVNTVVQPHRMCNEVQTCAPFCSCDDYYGALPPPPPPAFNGASVTATGTCNVEEMSSLKSKLTTMIAAQKTKNAALTQTVYPGTTPFPPPAAPSPPPAICAGGEAKQYAQCGGKTHKGATCCESGTTCKFQNAYYSQCRAA